MLCIKKSGEFVLDFNQIVVRYSEFDIENNNCNAVEK